MLNINSRGDAANAETDVISPSKVPQGRGGRLGHCALALAAAMIVLPHAAEAQGGTSFRSSDARIASAFMAQPGVLVEAAGLDRWTIERVREALGAVGATLFRDARDREKLRALPLPEFAQSVIYQSRGDSAVTVFLAVIEPGDSHLVTVRELGNDTTGSTVPWPALVELGRAPFRVLERGVVRSVHARAAGMRPRLSMTMRADSVELTKAWAALDAHRTAEDAATAREVLRTSPNIYDRVAAVAILSNFDREDATWHALVGALLDPEEEVREYARALLRVFTSDFTREVDWGPVAVELHAILQGSDLFFLPDALDMLVATGVGPEDAAPLLRDGGHAVLMFAGAQNPWARGPAHRFLRAVSGRDGGTPGEWRDWIAELSR